MKDKTKAARANDPGGPSRRTQEARPVPGPKGRKSPARSIRLLVLAVSLAVLGIASWFLATRPGGGGLDLRGASADNIVLLTLDTTRADHLGCYGDAQARTPNLDALAAGGIRFSRVYSPAPLTLPSHTSIMSGLYPLAHGVRNNGHDLPSGVRTLAEILKGRGYATAAFVSSFSVDSRFGIGRGFDLYDDTFEAQQPLKSPNAERRAEETFGRFSRWFENNWQKRFFVWVHYYDPHWPYDPPSPYKEEFASHLYDGEIAYMDHYVGAVLERLGAKGILDKTLIVVAGDHGEGLGDKVEIGHGIFVYDETLRVPLIFSNHGVFRRPRTIDSLVRLVDVAPTLLEIVGLEGEATRMQGRSLVPWLGGKARQDLDALVESFYPRENFGWSELVGLVSGPWKFIQAPRPELYDLAADPGEKENLFVPAGEKSREMSKKLEGEILRLSSGGTASGGTAAVRASDQERLRSLGYVNFAPARPGASAPDPKDRIALLELVQKAQAYEMSEKFPEAEKVYRDIVAEIPDSPESYVNLALVLARQAKFDQAIQTLSTGVARLPDSEGLLVRLGHTYLVAGKTREAQETMDKVLAMNPRNVDALTVGAGILEASGRKDEARAYYERALAAEPESQFLRMRYAANLASGGKLREAIAVYEKLINDFPEEQGFYQFAGIAHSYLGEYDQAISLLRQALALAPTPIGYFNLAVAYEKTGNNKEAAAALRLYLENTRGESDANIRRARAELDRLDKLLGK